MRYPLTLSFTAVQLDPEDAPRVWVRLREDAKDDSGMSIEMRLPALDSPTDMQDYIRQVLAGVCEAV